VQAGTASYKATIVRAVNPYCHAQGRQVYELDSPLTPAEWAKRAGVDTEHTIICVDADYWLRKDWDRPIPHGAIVQFIPVPKGGGGSNPLQAILLIAVAIASVYTGGAAAAAYGAATGVAAGAAASAGMMAVQAGVSMAVMAAGSMLVNAIVPAKTTSVAQGTTNSPTYSLSSSGNTARLLEAIPVLYGRMNVTPDLAATPYTEYLGNDLYVYELFCISKGEIDIEQILIGTTDIGNFSEIDYQVIGPNQAVTLFPDNVVTSNAVSGIELQAPNDSGDWVGPFVANPAASAANFIGIDITLPSGLFYAADDGSLRNLSLTFETQARRIDNAGAAAGDWIGLDLRELSMATSQPQQISYRYGVTPGRYEVRMRRTTSLNTDTRAQNRIQWAALRAYLPGERYYGNVTLLAMRARATNSLNSSTAHDVHVIATRKLPVWTGSGWSDPQPTKSIAWAIADAVRNADYSLGLPDRRLDIDALERLDAVWTSRGDEFNGVFDTKGAFWDALTTICRAGRAIPMYFGGVISVVRDELKTVRTAMYTPQNIVAGSFEADYGFFSVDSPDHVTVEYMDETTWSWQDVSCIPTGSPALVEKRIQMVGPTKRAQAWREGIYMAYANRDQRKTVMVTTELEGLVPLYGDLVGISHDLPKWGISGVVEGFDGVYVDVSERLEWTAGAQHYVYFSQRNGAPTAALRVVQPADGDGMSMTLLDPLPAFFDFSDGHSEEPTRFSFGPAIDRIAQDVRLIKATPRDGQVELTFVNNAESPHTAETGLSPPAPVSPSLLPGVIHAPIIAQVSANSKITPGSVSITASPAAGALLYEYQGSLDAGVTWAKLGTSTGNVLTVPIALGAWEFRVRAYGASGLPGPFATWTGTVDEFRYPPAPPVLTLREPFSGNQLSVEIQRLPDADYFDVSVVLGGVTKYEATITAQNFTWTLDQAKFYGAVASTFDVRVSAGNIAGLGNPGAITVTSQPPPAPAVMVYGSESGDTVTLSFGVTGYPDVAGYRVVGAGGAIIYDGTLASCTVSQDGRTYTVHAYNAWGSVSTGTPVVATPPGSSGGGPGDGGGPA
jgi:predicted phage tail protein